MMNITRTPYKTILLVSGWIYLVMTSAVGIAVENTSDIVHIVADEMHFDMQSESSIYNGNVKMTQGSIEILGEYIEIKQENNEILSMIAKGNPAQFFQSDIEGNTIEAQSLLIEYLANKNQLVMINQAKLKQDDQVIESEHIIFNTKTKTLKAGQRPNQNDPTQRVKITLTPNNKP